MAAQESRHAILDGKVQLYLRSGSPNWQCACSVGGQQHRANTGEDGLTRAAAFAHDWYRALANDDGASRPIPRAAPIAGRRGPRSTGSAFRQTFREAASRFMVEFEALTQGQRNPIYVAGHRARLTNYLIPFFGAMSVHEIDASVIAEYRVMRMGDRHRGAPPARSTLHQEIVCLRQVLKTAIRLRWIDHLIEGADIYQVAKNCRTSVEMIEKYYAAHIKDVIDAAAVNVRKGRKSSTTPTPAPSTPARKARRSTPVRL